MDFAFNFLWWNTGVAPPTKAAHGGKRSSADAIRIIKEILSSREVSFMGLCEINPKFVEELNDSVKCSFGERYVVDSFYEIFEEDDRRKYSILDIACIYDKDKVKTDGRKIVEFVKEDKTEWHGIKVPTIINECNVMLYMIHFPSKEYQENVEFSHLIGKLRDEMFIDKKTQSVIAMGDFNQDLYSENVAGMFRSSDDPQECISSNKFYNPFWKHLGNRLPLYSSCKRVLAGSHYYTKMKKWNYFDFALVSPDLIIEKK